VEAWVGSFDALLHKDMASLNARLAEESAAHKDVRLVPFGSVNPRLPDWQEDLRRCAEVHRMPGIRLHPNYHGYTLDDPEFAAVVKVAAERQLIVQLAIIMEDERMMHPMFRAAPVDPKPLLKVVRDTPGLKLELLNAVKNVKGEQLADLAMAGDVYVEIAMQEGVNGVETLLKSAPLERVLFGSFSPAFYFEAAPLKLQESPLAKPQVQAICETNARRLLPRS
jgi:predicted TIM-barrel fold metal-dependent hydrolase